MVCFPKKNYKTPPESVETEGIKLFFILDAAKFSAGFLSPDTDDADDTRTDKFNLMF